MINDGLYISSEIRDVDRTGILVPPIFRPMYLLNNDRAWSNLILACRLHALSLPLNAAAPKFWD